MKRKEVIGTAQDCLSNINDDDGSVSLVATTSFFLPKGTLVSQGEVTVQPVLVETILESGEEISHITGSSNTGSSVIAGTGIYEERMGNVRLSGMVNMKHINDVNDPRLFFSCIFEIKLDLDY